MRTARPSHYYRIYYKTLNEALETLYYSHPRPVHSLYYSHPRPVHSERILSAPTTLSSSPDDDFAFTFDDSLFDAAAREILDAGGYSPSMLSGKNGSALINETFRAFDEAIGSALGSKPDPAVAAALRENAFVFSGFKTHAELEQVAALITDEKGNIRPFNEFLNDVKQINQEYNHRYLRTEYNQAVQSAQMASKWADFERDKAHINLQYRTADDERVRASHRVLHGVTLPVDDKFWQQYTPPNGWGCRCTVVAVPKDDADYPVQDSHGSIAKAETCFKTAKEKMFKENMAERRRLFPSKHPYLPKGCGNCGKGVGSKNLAYNPNSVWCLACKAIAKCERKLPIGTQKESYKRFLEYGKKNLIGKVTYSNECFKGKTALFTRQSIVHSISYGELYYAKIDVLNNIEDYFKDIKEIKQVPIEHNEKGNIAAMYEAKVKYKGDDEFGKGREMLLQFKEYVDGKIIFYFIKFI